MRTRSVAEKCRGFSLIELLVAIGVIGVLVSILLPALSRARSAARQSRCLANLHGAAAAFEFYGQHYRESYPFAPANSPLPITPDEPRAFVSSSHHWTLAVAWPALMHDVAPWREFFATWVCPGSPRAPGAPWRLPDGLATGVPSYTYCRAFMADPATWRPGATAEPAYLRAVTAAEVTFPSSKVLLFDAEMAHTPHRDDPSETDARPMLMSDGAAAIRRWSRATPAALNPFIQEAVRLHDTPEGVRGHDY